MSTSPDIMETDERMQEVAEDDVEEQELLEKEDEGELEGEAEADKEEGGDDDEENPTGEGQVTVESGSKEKKSKKQTIVRGLGELILPFSRVQKVIKADKDIPMVARDAVFLIGLATEAFITELAAAAHRVAVKEKRATVQHKDIATVVRKADEFMFLEDILPYTIPTSVPENKTKRSKLIASAKKHSGRTLDKFVVSNKERAAEDKGTNVVMNDDGTLYVVGIEPSIA